MLGLEVSPVVQYVIAFAIVAALLALFAVVLRRIGGKRFAMQGPDRGRGRQPRLGIVDVYDLDRQRQLVLLRRDNVEHLVMLGGPNDLVVESNIVRVSAGRAPVTEMQNGRPESGQEQGRALPELAAAAVAAAVPAPMLASGAARSAVGGGVRERETPARGSAFQPRQEAQLAPTPSAQASAPGQETKVEPPAAASPPTPALQPEAPPSQAPAHAPQPPAAESPLADLEALIREKPKPMEPAQMEPAQMEPAQMAPAVTAPPAPPAGSKRGLFGFGSAAGAPPPPPAFPPRPRATPVAPDFAPPRPPSKFAPADAPQADRVEPPSAETAVETQPKPARPRDDAILADMAKQLETALARPRSSTAAPSVALKPAAPPAQPPREPIDGPSEPKSYKPVATAAATVAAVASVFRSSSMAAPTAQSSPVPPRPYGGEQPVLDAVAPIEASRKVESRVEYADAKESDIPEIGSGSFEAGHFAAAVKEAGAPVAVGNTGDDTRTDADAPDDATREAAATAPENPTEEQGSEEDLPQEDLHREDLHREDLPQEELDASHQENRPGHDSPEVASPEENEPEQSTSFPAPPEAEAESGASEEERKEPAAAVVDPFSVDEIEAEFARLLGRSVDKDPKSP